MHGVDERDEQNKVIQSAHFSFIISVCKRMVNDSCGRDEELRVTVNVSKRRSKVSVRLDVQFQVDKE